MKYLGKENSNTHFVGCENEYITVNNRQMNETFFMGPEESKLSLLIERSNNCSSSRFKSFRYEWCQTHIHIHSLALSPFF